MLTGTVVAQTMQAVLWSAVTPAPGDEPVGRRLVRAGVLKDADVRDLLEWQWLLNELGEYRRLGELAAAAGLMTDPIAVTVAGEPVERKAPAKPAVPNQSLTPVSLPEVEAPAGLA
jgi:hypothetical protein